MISPAMQEAMEATPAMPLEDMRKQLGATIYATRYMANKLSGEALAVMADVGEETVLSSMLTCMSQIMFGQIITMSVLLRFVQDMILEEE